MGPAFGRALFKTVRFYCKIKNVISIGLFFIKYGEVFVAVN